MKKTVSILSVLFLFSCNSGKDPDAIPGSISDKAAEMTDGATNQDAPATSSNFKKYELKSGIVTFETSMQMSGMDLKSKKIIYFDDYGLKECEEEYKINPASGKEELANRSFVKDGFRYTCSVENESGAKTKAMGYGVAVLFNMDEASTMKDNKFKKLADETIAGKNCSAFSVETPSGLMKMYGWKGITLKTDLTNASMGLKTMTSATKIEENARIPSDKFEVPKGVKMTDM